MVYFSIACGGFYYSPTGIIESPEWPSRYKGKTHCTWRVSADPGEKISLRFNSFNLEEDGSCNKAKLVVRDGSNKDSNVLGVYCGIKKPPTLTSTGNRLWLQFTSTNGAEGKGFLLYYDTGDDELSQHTLFVSVNTAPHFCFHCWTRLRVRWTGTSLRRTVLRGVMEITCDRGLFARKRVPRISLHSMLVPVQLVEYEYGLSRQFFLFPQK